MMTKDASDASHRAGSMEDAVRLATGLSGRRMTGWVPFVRVAPSRFFVPVVIFVVIFLTPVPPLHAQPGRATRPQVTPPQGPARQVIFTYCTNCHGIDDYAYNALDRDAWDAHLTAKHRNLDVPLPAAERAVLLDWLAERFGPTSKPFPRAYVAPEVTTFFTDVQAEALLKQACTACHELDRVNSARFSPDRWRVVTVDMRERGAKIDDEQLERLVEWLGRTKGTNDSDRQ